MLQTNCPIGGQRLESVILFVNKDKKTDQTVLKGWILGLAPAIKWYQPDEQSSHDAQIDSSQPDELPGQP